MANEFNPPDIKIYGEDGKLQFSDAYGLTCVQMGAALGSLLEASPSARLTREDLVGYHFMQYGMFADVIKDTIEIMEQGHTWSDWDKATQLRETLPQVIGETTTGAVMQRIRVGRVRHLSAIQLSPGRSAAFDEVEEKDERDQDVVSWYPKDGTSLQYLARFHTRVGTATMSRIIDDMSVATDLMEVVDHEGDRRYTVIATSLGHSAANGLKSVHVVTNG